MKFAEADAISVGDAVQLWRDVEEGLLDEIIALVEQETSTAESAAQGLKAATSALMERSRP